MDSGTAAIVGAAIGFVGSTLGSVVVPFLTRRNERNNELERARTAALRRIIPELLEAATGMRGDTDTPRWLGTALSRVAELETWLLPSEWQIGRIALRGSVHSHLHDEKEGLESQAVRLHAMATVLPAWMRGELTAAEAAAYWTEQTGEPVAHPIHRNS